MPQSSQLPLREDAAPRGCDVLSPPPRSRPPLAAPSCMFALRLLPRQRHCLEDVYSLNVYVLKMYILEDEYVLGNRVFLKMYMFRRYLFMEMCNS